MFQKKSRDIFNSTTKSPSKIPTKLSSVIQLQYHKKSQSLIGSLKVKLNPQQPDYKRYKKQQEASLKIFEDYEEGH